MTLIEVQLQTILIEIHSKGVWRISTFTKTAAKSRHSFQNWEEIRGNSGTDSSEIVKNISFFSKHFGNNVVHTKTQQDKVYNGPRDILFNEN